MRILFTTQALTIGGIEVLALRFSEAFGAAGHDVTLYDFSPQRRVESFVAQFDHSKFRLAGVSTRAWWWKLSALLHKTRLKPGGIWEQKVEQDFARLLADNEFDVICSLSFHQDYLACKYAQLKRTPVVVSMHGVYEYAAPEWPERARAIYDYVSAIIYAADKNMSYYWAQPYFRPAMPTAKIYTGTDLDSPIPATATRASLGLADDAFVYILVARGIKEKGWAETITAFRGIRQRHPRAALLLVGDGEYVQQLKAQHAAEPGIVFYGFHPSSVELTQLADVGLLPTYFPIETLPNVVIDYLRCGLPVVSTAIGEIPDMLQAADGQPAGTVLPLLPANAGLDPALLAEAMERYLTDPVFYQAQADRVQEVRRKFDIRTCVRRYLDLFEQVLAK
jgi:glycosyltransferase involved in cell wall biosynthesis